MMGSFTSSRKLYALAFLLLASFLHIEQSCSFSISPVRKNKKGSLKLLHDGRVPISSPFDRWNKQSRPSAVILHASKNGRRTDPGGLRRGAIILPLVLLACVWIFSIPTEVSYSCERIIFANDGLNFTASDHFSLSLLLLHSSVAPASARRNRCGRILRASV
jgi:hypothetical protein